MTSTEQKPGTTLVERLTKAANRKAVILVPPDEVRRMQHLLSEAASVILSLQGARAEIAALVPDDADPGDDTDNQAGYRNAIEHALQLIDAALSSSEHI